MGLLDAFEVGLRTIQVAFHDVVEPRYQINVLIVLINIIRQGQPRGDGLGGSGVGHQVLAVCRHSRRHQNAIEIHDVLVVALILVDLLHLYHIVSSRIEIRINANNFSVGCCSPGESISETISVSTSKNCSCIPWR